MSEPRLVVEGLCIDGPDGRLVAGTSFVARDGQVLGVTGPSGAGKSLAMRAAMGVVDVRPGIVAGQLRYEGTGTADLLSGRLGHPDGMARLEAATARFRGGWITLAPQAAASALNPARTVGAHLHRALARADPSVRGSVAGWLERVGLHASVMGLLPGALSGGMAQRVGIALALAPAPQVLIADEPEAGLDPVLRGQILELLADVATASGCATVLVSHDHRALASIAHHAVLVEAP